MSHRPRFPTLIIFALILTTGVASYFVFSHSQPAFAAPTLDLTIGSTSYYNGASIPNSTWSPTSLDDSGGAFGGNYLFFNLSDVKPGDIGENTIGIRPVDMNAWACFNPVVTKDDENTANNPELKASDQPDIMADNFDGELSSEINTILWADDDDNVLEDDESIIANGPVKDILNQRYTLADTSHNIWGSGPLTDGITYHLGHGWCFGTLTPTALGQDGVITRTPESGSGPGYTCDAATNNTSQTDLLTVTMEFISVQSDQNESFDCQQCSVSTPAYANAVTDSNQGLQQNGAAVAANRSDPTAALGTPEQSNSVGTFYSLGFGGDITIQMPHPVEDLPGDDLGFYEVTYGTYPVEKALVAVSQDGVNFTDIGTVDNNGNVLRYLNINGAYPWIRYVRLTDTTDISLFTTRPNADGYDLDGIEATNSNLCL